MSDNNDEMQTNSVPGWFWAVSGIALVWNLLGVMAFVMHINITAEMLALMPEAERALYENAPSWMGVVFAIAVFSGTLGCVALLMKKSWASSLFVISLVTVLIQNGYSFFMTNALEVMGNQAIVMPSIVIVIAIALVWFAGTMNSRNILE